MGLQSLWALDSHQFFRSRAALGQCFLAAAAASVPSGVVLPVAEPSSWHTGGCAGCCGGRFTVFGAHSPKHSDRLPQVSLRSHVCEAQLRSGRPPHVSPRFRVHEAHPLRVLSRSSTTCLTNVRPNNSTSFCGAHGHCAHLHGFCGCRAHRWTTAPGLHGRIPVWVPLLMLKAALFPSV